jgi:hypothetical protein
VLRARVDRLGLEPRRPCIEYAGRLTSRRPQARRRVDSQLAGRRAVRFPANRKQDANDLSRCGLLRLRVRLCLHCASCRSLSSWSTAYGSMRRDAAAQRTGRAQSCLFCPQSRINCGGTVRIGTVATVATVVSPASGCGSTPGRLPRCIAIDIGTTLPRTAGTDMTLILTLSATKAKASQGRPRRQAAKLLGQPKSPLWADHAEVKL